MASFGCRTVEVTGHHEVDGHTMYVIEGTAGDASWRAEKRLVELRALHDRVVESLGRPRYDTLFAGACFASRGGLPGTTGKLNCWCKRLFESLGDVPDELRAFVFESLGAPRENLIRDQSASMQRCVDGTGVEAIAKDVPRLARRCAFVDDSSLDPPTDATPLAATAALIAGIATLCDEPRLAARVAELGSAAGGEAAQDHVAQLVGQWLERELGGSASLRVLSLVHQGVILVCMEALRLRGPLVGLWTRDSRDASGWQLEFARRGVGEGRELVVRHLRTEHSVDTVPGASPADHWEFSWSVSVALSADAATVREATLEVNRIDFAPTCSETKRAEIQSAFAPYMKPQVPLVWTVNEATGALERLPSPSKANAAGVAAGDLPAS